MKYLISLEIEASDILEQEGVKEGLQNLMDEFNGDNELILQLTNKEDVKFYRQKLQMLLNNPIIKKIAQGIN